MNHQRAIEKVEGFATLLQRSEEIVDADVVNFYRHPEWKSLKQQISQQIGQIEEIAKQVDADLVVRLRSTAGVVWDDAPKVEPVQELLGRLRSAEETAEILGPQGPTLTAARMHRWVWENVASLWDDGYHWQAVQTAASAIFDTELPKKLGVSKGTQPEALVGMAFDERSPKLLLPSFTEGTKDWTNAYQGAANLGRACAKLVRNLSTHNVNSQPNEDVALEELAMLSRFARLVDSATVAP